jgi:RimJ/RimL family protein N-acetyltransferase
MQIREITGRDMECSLADKFIEMQLRLDEETEFMMYEPGERKPNRENTEKFLREAAEGEDLLLVAEDKDRLWGFLSARRGGLNRIHHSAYIVTGICKDYRNKGIGTAFFGELDKWAAAGGIKRLELTVMCHNEAALHLYEKSGFQREGIKKNSMVVNGQFADEFYMAKLL